jgi:hypothetical protein
LSHFYYCNASSFQQPTPLGEFIVAKKSVKKTQQGASLHILKRAEDILAEFRAGRCGDVVAAKVLAQLFAPPKPSNTQKSKSKEPNQKSSRAMSLEKRTDWQVMKVEVSRLISRLRDQPKSEHGTNPKRSAGCALMAFSHGEIGVEQTFDILTGSLSEPKLVSERTDVQNLRREMQERRGRILVLESPPVISLSKDLAFIISELANARLTTSAAEQAIEDLFYQTPISDRTDWDELAAEVVHRVNRLKQKPQEAKNRLFITPRHVFEGCLKGDISIDEADSLVRLMLKPTETGERLDCTEMRNDVTALLARLQEVQEHFVADAKECSPTEVLIMYRKGAITFDQADAIITEIASAAK